MLNCFWSQVMFATLSSYHGCMRVIPGDCSLYDYGTILLAWLHLYKGKNIVKFFMGCSEVEIKACALYTFYTASLFISPSLFISFGSHLLLILLQAGCPKPNRTTPLEPVYPVSTNGELFPWTQVRLPRSISPLSYELILSPDLDDMTFIGRTIINMSVRHKTKFIVLHSASLNITKATFKVGFRLVCLFMNPLIDFFFLFLFTSCSQIFSLFQLDDGPAHNVTVLEYKPRQQIAVKFTEELKADQHCVLTLEYSANLSHTYDGFYNSSYTDKDGNKRYIVLMVVI